MHPSLRPCVFFDRDGIANVRPTPEEYYVLRPERLFVIPEFLESLRIVAERGYAAVIVTNQFGIAKGLLSPEGLHAIHARLRAAVADAGARLLDIYACPHGDNHPDRKPNPGMLLRAAREHELDLGRSWMIGDDVRDIRAGKAAGCAVTVFVQDQGTCALADYQVSNMAALPEFLRQKLP